LLVVVVVLVGAKKFIHWISDSSLLYLFLSAAVIQFLMRVGRYLNQGTKEMVLAIPCLLASHPWSQDPQSELRLGIRILNFHGWPQSESEECEIIQQCWPCPREPWEIQRRIVLLSEGCEVSP
jgi:hypothetical protein